MEEIMGLTHGDPWGRGPNIGAHVGDGGNKEVLQGYITDKPLPQTLPDGSSSDGMRRSKDGMLTIAKSKLILASMSNNIQKQYDRLDNLASILQRMKEVYAISNRYTRYVTTKEFFRTKMTEGEASTSKAKGKRAGRWKRKKGKAKAKAVIAAKDDKSAPVAPLGMGNGKRKMGTQQQSRANDICTHCREKGHWKRDCPKLPPKQGMFFVKVLQRTRKLSEDEVVLRLGDGKAVAAEAVRGGSSYFITFTDDHSQYGNVDLMRYKSEDFVRFKKFRLKVENQTSRKIKTLQSDQGGEYLSGEFLDHLKENGIVSQWTPPGTPQLNGVAEIRNQTLLNMVRP
ncbi:hypothetical protein Sango_2313300 [Sesamum angolense]|uniref:Uncharacterized protein n=1 Tax=Sesamum angolense TaxID=2727404 RepID=A0AAE2BLH4_9LAMI|nr:hypothetical protein Sango_2313300 [Sesamum angolense]